MDQATLVGATEREGRTRPAAAPAGLDAPAPSCPGWTVADARADQWAALKR